MEAILVAILIGAIAGWLAGKIMGSNFGLIGDILLGIAGGFAASFLLGNFLSISLGPWWLTSIVWSTLGAVILIFLFRLIKKA